jgi:hypothetical protein
MEPFEYVLLLLSFIFTIALTHVLTGAARMIQHRRELSFSWPHALWMAQAFLLVVVNWAELWDFHTLKTIDLPTYLSAIAICVGNYFYCALVTPDFERGESFDLVAFHRTQGRTYLAAGMVLIVISLVVNAAASAEGVTSWAAQNGLVLAMGAAVATAMIWRNRVVQIASPLVTISLTVAAMVISYPTLA